MTTGILELVQFKLIDGKTDADLASTHEAINDFLSEQSGFMYRSISRRECGTYVDIVYWDNLDSAKNASHALMQDSRGQAMLALCDMSSVSIQHLPILSEAMSANCEEAA